MNEAKGKKNTAARLINLNFEFNPNTTRRHSNTTIKFTIKISQ